MSALNQPAPELVVDRWSQGEPSSLANEIGNVVLIEVFQVNCPGCFIGGLPEAIGLFQKYGAQGLTVWGLATAFEDFDKNNQGNLEKLLSRGEVIGETLAHLGRENQLDFNRLRYEIPFPVAWDKLEKSAGAGEEAMQKIIARDIPHFTALPAPTQEAVKKQVADYLRKKIYDAQTFETYQLKGTPSAILIDKKGLLRHKIFGFGQGLEELVRNLLDE